MAEFDVFLSHSSKDKAAVRAVGEDLKARGVTVWLDEWELQPGKRWQRELEAAIAGSRSVAVFVGANGLGPWEEPEMEVFLDRAMRESELPVIPVLLPGAPEKAELRPFLKLFTWVDLRKGVTPEGLERLVWGITGKKPDGTTTPQTRPRAASARATPPATSGPPGGPAEPARGKSLWQRWEALLAVAGVLIALGAWLWPRSPDGPGPGPQRPDLYALRVQVVDPGGRPVSGAKVRASAGNEPQLLPDGWWEVEIPRVKVPQDGHVEVWAESPAWDGAHGEVVLGTEPNPRLELTLRPPASHLGGVVQDRRGRLVAGARVLPLEARGSEAVTNASGRFELELAVPKETRVRLRTEAPGPGGGSAEAYCYAGRDSCILELEGP